ncbi:hypothetical protein QQP08_026356 [Theobroma cacao]|nr:hypothetical protein QQP08_024187 [Theobroma cacao]WRX33869.1 hypothetical protein QQP08_026356 [Theobroma cacao]
MEFQVTTPFSGICSKTSLAISIQPHFPYMSTREEPRKPSNTCPSISLAQAEKITVSVTELGANPASLIFPNNSNAFSAFPS